MTAQSKNSATSSRNHQSAQALVRDVREVLERSDLESQNHRKAALRACIHEKAAGLTKEEIEDLIADLRGRFPDRVYESVSSAQGLATHSAELEEKVARLSMEEIRLRKQVDYLESLMSKLAAAAGTPASQAGKSVAVSPTKRVLAPQAQGALVEVAALLFPFALVQEETARSVEEILSGDSADASTASLAKLLTRLSEGGTLDRNELEGIRQRLRSLQILPGALMAGAQQSWKGGTREILEYLDPKATKSSILGVPNYPMIIKEFEQSFAQFWEQFDRNIENYYRGRFDRAYRDKMEDKP